MKKVILMLGCIFLLCISLPGCGNKKSDAPSRLTITANTATIPYVVGKNIWNGSVFDRQDTFKMYTEENKEFEYIKLFDTIKIEFLDAVPDSLKLKDYILNKNGDVKYTEKEIQNIDIQLDGNKIEFELPTNIATSLSSYSYDYEPGASIRGFRLTCSWGKNECEYAFIIRTDARQ